MEFQLYKRKFKFVDDELFSFYKTGKSKTEKWYKIKLTLTNNDYKTFGFIINGKTKKFKYHRAVYYAHNPEWNIYDSSKYNLIDHVDRIKTNNHISNLRNVTNQENGFNRACKGYHFHKATGKYEARIQLNGKNIYLGLFDTPDEAREAYLRKKAELHIIPQRIHN
tara:strand:- start:144 stop:641 length:498 start_codon:yes stop_codon:yes gene_type:complete